MPALAALERLAIHEAFEIHGDAVAIGGGAVLGLVGAVGVGEAVQRLVHFRIRDLKDRRVMGMSLKLPRSIFGSTSISIV